MDTRTLMLLALLMIGMNYASSVRAHEDDNHDAEKPQRVIQSRPPKGASSNLANQATNPASALIQFQLQNVYAPSVNNANGSSNRFVIQPVVPFHLSDDNYFQNLLTRTTLPVITTPSVQGSEGSSTTELGDTTMLINPVHHWDSSPTTGYTWGPILALQFPTATDNRTGSDKWNAGPGAVFIGAVKNVFAEGDTLQFGAYGYNVWSYAGSDSRNNTNKLFMAPILTYHFGSFFGQKDWYLRLTDELWSFDWEESGSDKSSIPVGLALGRVFSIGAQQFNVFLAGDYYVEDRGTDPEWDIKLNVTLLFPE